jgi:hypothetical protein
MESTSVSMVINDQLPLIVRKCTKNGYIFSPDLLGLSVNDINEKAVSNSLNDDGDRELWSRLLRHFVYMKRSGSIDSTQLAQMFAPALLGQLNYGTEKATKFLEKIINSATAAAAAAAAGGTNLLVTTESLLTESKSLTETSINQDLLLRSSSKLKETPVYQQFLANEAAQTSQKARIGSDEDENSEIDAVLAPKSVSSDKFQKGSSPRAAGIFI